MTVTDTAFEIANRFLDSGKKRNDLELAILRSMESHIAAEREACARVADDHATRMSNMHNKTSAVGELIRRRTER